MCRRDAWAPPCGPAAGPTMRRPRGPPTAAERVGSTVSPPPPAGPTKSARVPSPSKSAGGERSGLGQASASVEDEQGARGECAEGCSPCGRRNAWAPPCGPAAGPTKRRSRGPPRAAERAGSTVSPPPAGREERKDAVAEVSGLGQASASVEDEQGARGRVHAEHVGAPVADEAFRCEWPAPGTHGHVKRTPRQLPPSPGGLERVHAERVEWSTRLFNCLRRFLGYWMKAYYTV
jgi:hypothetical protein